MGKIPPRDQILFYRQEGEKDPQYLFDKTDDGLAPIDLDASEASPSILSILGEQNYRTLIQTVKGSKEGLTKIEDKAHGKVVYLVPIPKGMTVDNNEGQAEFVTKRNLEQLAKAVKERKPSHLTHHFSRDFLQTAPLLTSENEESRIECTHISAGADPTSPYIDVRENTVTIGDNVYDFSFKVAGKNVSLENMSPKKREAFMLLIREAAMKATPAADLDAIEKFVLSFEDNEFQDIKIYGDDDQTPLHRVLGTDKTIEPLKKDLNKLVVTAHSSLSSYHRHDSYVGGIPRGSQEPTCWLSTGLHLIANTFGHHLEKLDLAGRPDLELIRSIKRKILKEEKGTVTDQDLRDLWQAIQQQGWQGQLDISQENDPAEFFDLFQNNLFHQFQLSDVLSLRTVPQSGASAEALIIGHQTYQALGSNPPEISLWIERNAAGTKDASPVPVTKTIKLGADTYELVAMSEHIGPTPAGGHHVAYSKQHDTWFKCDDERVSKEKDEDDLLNRLSTSATQLVYRKLPQPVDAALEASIGPLHSQSRVDYDKWLGSKVVFDYAAKCNPNATVLKMPSGRPFYAGATNDLAAIEAAIRANPNKCLYIPMVEFSKPGDTTSRHWVTLIMDQTVQPPVIEYFNSVGKPAPKDIRQLATNLALRLDEVLDDTTRWQRDGYRCGYYALQYLELRAQPQHNVQAIQGMQQLRIHGGSTDAVDDLRRRMKLAYNRYQPRYGFA